MTEKNITIIDVAKEAGVSKSTVSLALKDSPKIKPETKRKVKRIAKRMGYVYNRAAASLRQKSSNILGVIVNDLLNPHFAELTVAIESVLTEAGYIVVVINTSEDSDKQQKVIRSLSECGSPGVIICPALETTPDFVDDVKSLGIEMVVIEREIKGAACDLVSFDAVAGMMDATKHLIEQGADRLAFVGGREPSMTFIQKKNGFEKAIEQHDKPIESSIHRCDISRRAASEVIHELMSGPNPPNGIICYNDIIAFGVIFRLSRMNIRIGQDVAVVGFDNTIAAADINPGLTSVDIFVKSLGEQAAEALLRRIKSPEKPESKQLVSPVLVIRESSTLSVS